MTPRAAAAGAVLAGLFACSNDELVIPADRPVLGWSGSGAVEANRRLLPSGFTGPDEHACAQDPTRVYLGELFTHSLTDVQVNWHWAPIVSGPHPDLPTLDQAEISVAGTLVGASDSLDDVLADHPFGFDVNADVTPDREFAFLAFNGPLLTPRALHPEIETRIFPRAALGWVPQADDRALMRGAWVLDCGHPPYGAEMHPPTFLGYARESDPRTTIAVALAVPYRSSLLFNPDATLANKFDDTARFGLSSTKPFSKALLDALYNAVFASPPAQRLTTHALMTANRFDNLDWLVCAPLPRPAGAMLEASWRFTTRTGVTVRATRYDPAGCVRFTATMTPAYVPMPLPYADADWSWDDMSASASSQLGQSIDVRLAIINAFPQAATAPALQPDHPPRIDAYAPLLPRSGADQDSPTAIDAAADDQPFPLYGRIRVGWK